jgi:hypothetical protein
LLPLLLMGWRSSKESKEKYLKSIKFISNYFVDEITYCCSLYILMAKAALHWSIQLQSKTHSQKKQNQKKKLGAAWRRRKWAWGDVTTMRSADGFVQFDWEETHLCKNGSNKWFVLSTIW